MAVDPDAFELPPGQVTDDQIRAAKAETYRRRHELIRDLRAPGDHERPIDFAAGLLALAKTISEEVLAARGLRSASHGISRVDPKRPELGYRVQAWGEVKRPDGTSRTGHIHISYAPTAEIAQQKRREWWMKTHGIDIGSGSPAWLAPILRASAALQSERDEQQNEDESPPPIDNEPPEPGVYNHAEEMAKYWAWRNKSAAAKAVTSGSVKTCRNCGKPLPHRQHGRGRQKEEYCNATCQRNGQIKSGRLLITRTCVKCGKDFQTLRDNSRRHCSQKCAGQAIAEKHGPPRKCRECGNVFTLGTHKRAKVLCSEACVIAAKERRFATRVRVRKKGNQAA